jgi:hypothetical protein
MAQETQKVFSTDSPTYGYWFERFMKGCHKRMGDEVNSDYALSLDIVLELLKQLERDWRLAKTLDAQWQVCRFACFLIIGYCKALRGDSEDGDRRDEEVFRASQTPSSLSPLHRSVVGSLQGRDGQAMSLDGASL